MYIHLASVNQLLVLCTFINFMIYENVCFYYASCEEPGGTVGPEWGQLEQWLVVVVE